MSGYESLKGGNVESFNPTELQGIREHLTNADPQLSYYLSLSGYWNEDSHPRSDLTNYWNMPFYRGFYPDLPEDDILGYRVLATQDGDAWIRVKKVIYWSPVKDYNSRNNTDYIEYYDWELEKLKSLVDGKPLDQYDRELQELAPRSTLIQERLEQGMSRGARVFGALIGLRGWHANDSVEIGRLDSELFDALGLSDEERDLSRELITDIYPRAYETND